MIEIIYKTKNLVVIYKPSGIPAQSDLSGDDDAMKLTSSELEKMGEGSTLFLIHRLDRVVSGLMVFARDKNTAAALSDLVSRHDMTKEYYAVIHGKTDSGIMKDYLYKDSALGKAFVTDKKRVGAKEAALEYESLDTVSVNGNVLSLVKINLKTGRFHQIRAQFSSRKLPLVGDKKYGSKDFRAKYPSLVAARLVFNINGEEIDLHRLPDLDKYPWSLFAKEKYR